MAREARTEHIHRGNQWAAFAEDEDSSPAGSGDDGDHTTQDGDSTVGRASAASADGNAEAAVAATEGPGWPKERSKMRSWRRVHVMETASGVTQHQRELYEAWTERTQGEAGRIGFYVANFGQTAGKPAQRKDEFAQIAANPAQIIAICECDDECCRVLSGQADPRESTTAVADDKFRQRPRYAYLCVKGGEPSGTLLIGLRDRSGGCIECLDFARLFHKREKSKPKSRRNRSAVADAPPPKWHNKYSRAMVVRITLDQQLPHLGRSFNVMAVHVHHTLANEGWGKTKLLDFYRWFVDYVQHWDVSVCMGDFNMCMFQLVTWCRSCGVTVDVAAWTPWKTAGGQPRADSMAILFINCPGEYTLHHGLGALHDREGGFLTTAHDASYRVYDYKNGPGLPHAQEGPRRNKCAPS